ncbi:hypothetical protein Ahy_A04g019005 [Arachis hypogaea]|uniref:Uncharacterized protein n=1 Tax=Arachis hypogaea TaxID=3818 RepID=A0A445DF61_ARAHY|nr:hypothetical protein Ahy_A04g019005 [Arachis hypogaea]
MKIQSPNVALDRVRGVLILRNRCKIWFADIELGHDYSFLNPDYDFGLLKEKKLLDMCFSRRGSSF